MAARNIELMDLEGANSERFVEWMNNLILNEPKEVNQDGLGSYGLPTLSIPHGDRNMEQDHQKRYYAPFMGYKFIAYLCP